MISALLNPSSSDPSSAFLMTAVEMRADRDGCLAQPGSTDPFPPVRPGYLGNHMALSRNDEKSRRKVTKERRLGKTRPLGHLLSIASVVFLAKINPVKGALGRRPRKESYMSVSARSSSPSLSRPSAELNFRVDAHPFATCCRIPSHGTIPAPMNKLP